MGGGVSGSRPSSRRSYRLSAASASWLLWESQGVQAVWITDHHLNASGFGACRTQWVRSLSVRDDWRPRYPSAAASVREGLEDTLTVLTLGLSDRLRQSLATTNAIEANCRTRHVKRNVKRWRGGQMVLGGPPRLSSKRSKDFGD